MHPFSTGMGWGEDYSGERVYRELSEQEIELENIKATQERLIDHFKRTALVRYTEIWGNLSEVIDRETFVRGVDGTVALGGLFAAMLGALNKKATVRGAKKNQHKVIDMNQLYPLVKRLSQDTINNIRINVRERKRKAG